MILLIDNYDSFSYNLYQMVGTIEPHIQVVRNDAMTVDEVDKLHPDRIILSPGPGRPKDAGICEDLVRLLHTKYPILGVCLGEQSIFEAYGGEVGYAKKLMHGKQSKAKLDLSSAVFHGLPEEILVARYHSLAAKKETMPSELKLIAVSDDGEIMGVQDKQYPVFGLQFHPESIMTPMGDLILKNFISIQGNYNK